MGSDGAWSAGYFMKRGSIPGLKVGRDELTEEATRQIEGDRSGSASTEATP